MIRPLLDSLRWAAGAQPDMFSPRRTAVREGNDMDTQPNIFPVLRYQDGPAAIQFLTSAFGFVTKSDHRLPDGAVAHASLAFGPSVVGVSSESASSPGSPWSRVKQGVYVVVSDPDAAYEHAQAAGAEIVQPIADQSYGSRDFTLRDPEGHLWGFGTYAMERGAGAPTVFPEVLYRDAQQALKWMERGLGCRQSLLVPDDDGSVKHAELRLGDGVVFVGSAPQDGQFRGVTHFVNVHVDDPDAHFARAKQSGAAIVIEPQMSPFGARFYAAKDPEGFLWWISDYQPAA
jgi:uncharacterized glyoxalase superfamily protein PhnB